MINKTLNSTLDLLDLNKNSQSSSDGSFSDNFKSIQVANSLKQSHVLDNDFSNKSYFDKLKIVLSNDISLDSYSDEALEVNKDLLINESNEQAYNFFGSYVNLSSQKTLILSRNEKLTSYSTLNNIQNIVVLDKMNNFRKINKYFEDINEQLELGSYLLGSFETFRERMKNNRLNSVPVLGKAYENYEFLFKRVVPKLPFVKSLYFNITKGKDRLLSKAEALGRLVSCGFEIIDLKQIDGIYYYVAKKVKSPAYDMNPSYGPLFKMKRVGKNGKIIGVYKFRTMHPYSEYLQEYIVKQNGYSETGKPANDFRVVPWAKTLRRYWIDELPQLLNVLKGEMKLVGIRPVSKTYFETSIPKDIQELRLTQKPGCIPPYVALNRQSSVESVLQAEREYLQEKIRNPYFTDTKFFFKAIYNIVFKRKRSA